MQVKDLATLAGTTVRTVRYYHQLGLLGVPEQGQGWRSYGFAHLTRLMRIRWLVESGVPLSEVPHMLAPPANADERAVVVDDLDGVLAAIDERIDTLKEQRHRVATLLERVHSQGRLSPLPPAVVRLYAALAQRPLSPALAESMRRERDLLELACYHAPLPDDVVALVEGLGEDQLDAICGIWQECQALAAHVSRRLTPIGRDRITDLARQAVEVAEGVDRDIATRLLVRAADLDRPPVRAAVHLAYPSPVYRELFAAVLALAAERSGR